MSAAADATGSPWPADDELQSQEDLPRETIANVAHPASSPFLTIRETAILGQLDALLGDLGLLMKRVRAMRALVAGEP